MNSDTKHIKVIKVSDWKPGGKGTLPTRVVMWKPDDEKARHTVATENQYATHIEVQQEDGSKSFYRGHYDMGLAQATADFDKRVASL